MAAAQRSGVQTKSVAEVQHIAELTQDLIAQYFPIIGRLSNILYVAMATWCLESSFRLLHYQGTSMHIPPSLPSSGSAAYRGYYNDPVIRNRYIAARNAGDTATLANLDQGLVAHGLSATMGYYYVRGCVNSNALFKPYGKVSGDLGLQVDPGQSIINLFQANGELEKRRSLASGLMVLETGFKAAKSNGKSDSAALASAIGSYLGKAGVADVLGTTPEMRLSQITPANSKLAILQQAKITMDGSIVVANASVGASSSGASVPTSPSTGATTSLAASNVPGCSA